MTIETQPANIVAMFDDLGLLVQDCDQCDPSDQVIFKLLQMKALLATAFELDGFKRGVAVNPHAQNLAVEFSATDSASGSSRNHHHYVGFKTNERSMGVV